MLEIIPIDLREQWNEAVRSIPEYDFYCLAEYHSLDNSGIPLLLKYSDESSTILFPVILRDIEGTEYKDITSVYGYAGPISSNTRSLESISNFQQELLTFFDANNVVAAFSRLNPLLNAQREVLSGLGEIKDENLTVLIDLSLSEQEQRRQYTHSLKYAINKLNNKGFLIKKSNLDDEEIDAFINIYYETMDRVSASKSYYFTKDYFCRFLKEIDADLLLMYDEDKVIAGTIFTRCCQFVQVHLAATKSEYICLSPMKMLWDEVRKIGHREGFQFVHLGGGYGGKDDTLFNFKSHFSKRTLQFQTWRYVHNEKVYDMLTKDIDALSLSASSFFPKYRILINR